MSDNSDLNKETSAGISNPAFDRNISLHKTPQEHK
jgi:hypothetical protein